VINEVDGKKVKTPMELAAELSGKTPGSKIRIGYMYRSEMMGYLPKETSVVLGKNQ
jgi:PDZ domain-containing secreted protein